MENPTTVQEIVQRLDKLTPWQQKGRLIPDNDIWIAAIAMQHNLILVTRDSHFDEIESLQIERW